MKDYRFYCAGDEYSTFEKAVPAPLFVKSFDVNDIPECAELAIGCTGLFELYLNGENVTDGFLAPYISNSNDIVFFRKYDIADKLKRGRNVIGIILGNGFANPVGGRIWNHDVRENRGAPCFALEFSCGDYSFTAGDMKWTHSHILFDDLRCGTYCDRRLEVDYYTQPEIKKEIKNAPVPVKTPSGEFRFVKSEPVREIRRLKAIEISKGAVRDYRIRDCFSRIPKECDLMTPPPKSGGYIYDFGENCAGVPVLNIKGEPGQKIYMQFSELLFEGFVDYINTDVYPDGCCQQDIYICRGDKDGEIYIPPFTYHGARYCYIWGIDDEQATSELLEFAVIRNDVIRTSEFHCDNEMVQQIYDACIRSDESNLIHIITDCPAREKNGWTGDVAISAEHYMTSFAAGNCFEDYMHSLRTAQHNDGTLPLTVPSAGGSANSVVWDSVMFFVPYYSYIYSGDTKIIEDNCEAMMMNLKHHLAERDERGIIENGMGDWMPVNSAADSYASPLGFCCSFVVCEMCRMGTVMFKKIGRDDYAQFCEVTREALIDAIRKEYYNNGKIEAGRTEKYIKPTYRVCQTSQVLGLYGGIFKEDEKNKAFDILVDLIEKNKNSFDCGFLGLRYIFHVLSEYGRSDLAFKMITKPEHPSYANMIIRGETTVWERFERPGHRIGSHNHHFMADVSSWMIKNLAGIKVNPNGDNPDEVLIDPCYIDEVPGVSAVCKTPGGEVSVRWLRKNGTPVLDVQTSGNVKLIYNVEE